MLPGKVNVFVFQLFLSQHFLNFRPEPQGHFSLRPILGAAGARTTASWSWWSSWSSPS